MDEWLTRVVRESGSWWAAQRRIELEKGAALVERATQIAIRERGAAWLRGEQRLRRSGPSY